MGPVIKPNYYTKTLGQLWSTSGSNPYVADASQIIDTANDKHNQAEINYANDQLNKYDVRLRTTNGMLLKGNSTTILYVEVVRVNENGVEEDMTNQLTEDKFRWIRISNNPEQDKIWNEAHTGTKQIEVATEEVSNGSIFQCNVALIF